MALLIYSLIFLFIINYATGSSVLPLSSLTSSSSASWSKTHFTVLDSPKSDGEFPRANSVAVLIGTARDGNTFPGPARPFGYAKVGPDMDRATTEEPNNTPGGYRKHGLIEAFTLMHASGSGDVGSWETVNIMPVTGLDMTVKNKPISIPKYSRINESLALGYYSTILKESMTRVEIASTERTAIFRYTWSVDDTVHVVADLGAGPNPVGGHVEIVNGTTLTDGWSTGGLGATKGYFDVCICAQFDGPESVIAKAIDTGVPTAVRQPHSDTRYPVGYFEMKVWEEALSPITLIGATKQQEVMIYSSLYRTMLVPTNRTGDNPRWENDEFYFDETTFPLMLLLRPAVHSQFLRALADIGYHDSYIPDCRVADNNGRTQAGSNGVVVFADAAVKGVGADGVDWREAFKSMIRDAEEPPQEWLYEGRGDIKQTNALGYVPSYLGQADWYHRACVRTLEYSYNDFSIAQVARLVNDTQSHYKYSFRSLNWRNLWDDSIKSVGDIQGFIAPRGPDGQWISAFRDPTLCSLANPHKDCTMWNAEFYEASSWTYSFYAPHDMPALVKLSGGPEEFVRRIDVFLDSPGLFDIGNEPAFLIPYLYNYAGRPDKTAERVRHILAHNFSIEPDGLPGNDDAGSMGSWVIFGMIGIFPVAGQDLYLIGSPSIPEVNLRPDNRRDSGVDIIAHGASPENIYIQKAKLNGKNFNNSWIRHTELVLPGQINKVEFWMGASPSKWGTSVPPSLHPHEEYIVYGQRQVVALQNIIA
ncbi:hypothetical protein SmJEL517_g02689 [Synchytrium microbalum]|uniref:Alpha-1,2-mannosidase n=1 Tax=Synchytrium microbalum TaxID=1806994 RepID=A0A507C4P9_9FUNG|nr:uncharacterized protein SmJEL517_g02689 [Synchytrium microbalum]TPX34652.1 hypothetical protein SmJEL517_g02689 [Synchytrium microbalum]